MEFWHALVIERDFPAHQNVEHNPKTPDIHFWTSVLPCLEQLGSGKVKTAAKCLEQVSRGKEVTKTEINDFDIAGLADEDIFDFQVPMHNAIAMAVI